uniref:Cyclic AMP-responsive element-binding protein 3-like protein 2 n=1 Tax=Denticeps clupeoides TaxID=299321 RepID=A0AAY4C541_9TELE
MEILEGGEPFLHWDRTLSELSEPGDHDSAMYSTHFTELLDDLSQEALLGQLLSDPFLSGQEEAMDAMDEDLTPSSPVPPHIQAEHSYSLSGDSRPQSPLSHLPGEPGSETGVVSLNRPTSFSHTFCQLFIICMCLYRAAYGICLGLGLESLQMPPTPPSSHGSDSEGSQSPVHPSAPASPAQTPAVLKVAPRASSSSLSNSPLLTAPHKLQGSGPLLLTEEERRTLIAEGYPVPTKLPLTKAEEKALKKIRRKIKNKISAQESRRKKKEYMDALEKKVETCSNENTELRRKVETLECTNKSLLQQLHSLQAVVAGKVPRSCRVTGTQTSTCLMVVVMCFAVFLGSFYQGLSPCSSITKTGLPKALAMEESYTATVKSRSLLAYEDRGAMDEPHPSGLGGEYPEWDRQMDVMATWRLDQHHRQEQPETRTSEETHTPFMQNNETQTEKTAVLIDLTPHRTNESRKVVELERTVNETS